MSVVLPEKIEDCHELIKRLVELTDTLVVRIEKLKQENRELKERLNNNSSNSSKPPSQDFKKKKPKSPNPNKLGLYLCKTTHCRSSIREACCRFIRASKIK
jgi:transposase